MKPRIKCISCGRPLIAFQGVYLHPSKPCNGIQDMVDIEAEIKSKNEQLHNKFIEMYGKPEIDDYDRIELLESRFNLPLRYWLSKIFSLFHKR